jgi:hypothetical protein
MKEETEMEFAGHLTCHGLEGPIFCRQVARLGIDNHRFTVCRPQVTAERSPFPTVSSMAVALQLREYARRTFVVDDGEVKAGAVSLFKRFSSSPSRLFRRQFPISIRRGGR